MLKKNQLALILLTLVMMLTIYYIKAPFGTDNDNPDPENPGGEVPTSGRLEELTTFRIALREERELIILGLNAVIADNDATVEQKNVALEEKKYLTTLTEKELLLELQIMNKGYRDAFVHASTMGVEITVVANEHSVSIANEIILMTMLRFNANLDNICVEFQSAAEVMGTGTAA